MREKPAVLSTEQAAGVGAPFVTAWLAVVHATQVTAGETFLVTGSRGAVGSTPVQRVRDAEVGDSSKHRPIERILA